MMKNKIKEYLALGFKIQDAKNIVAEEILLSKLSASPLSEHVTLKGGIVMFNLTKNDRRVTQDIDFDLIRYSIDEESIVLFIEKMNSIDDDVYVSIIGGIEALHQEDYHGVRVTLLLKDKNNYQLRIKLDIGVHTYSAIEQKRVVFSFDQNKEIISLKVNPSEQMFAEKLISLARLGPFTTRYKDIYDMYYLIDNNFLDLNKVKNILNLFIASSKRGPHTMGDLVSITISTLNDKNFSEETSNSSSRWLDVDYEVAKKTIVSFVEKF